MDEATPPMLIEIYADIACPWCYIGERRLERALAERPDLRVERHWRPFQLQPTLPPDGEPWAAFVERKFGGLAQAQGGFARVAAAGAEEGVLFAFDRMPKAPNTREAHRLIRHAADQGDEWPMVEALFAAYFAEGRDITDRDQLVATAASAGLDPAAARAFLASDEYGPAIDAAQGEAHERGVNSVPLFVFNGRYALSGAHPVEVFHEVFEVVEREYAPQRVGSGG